MYFNALDTVQRQANWIFETPHSGTPSRNLNAPAFEPYLLIFFLFSLHPIQTHLLYLSFFFFLFSHLLFLSILFLFLCSKFPVFSSRSHSNILLSRELPGLYCTNLLTGNFSCLNIRRRYRLVHVQSRDYINIISYNSSSGIIGYGINPPSHFCAFEIQLFSLICYFFLFDLHRELSASYQINRQNSY